MFKICRKVSKNKTIMKKNSRKKAQGKDGMYRLSPCSEGLALSPAGRNTSLQSSLCLFGAVPEHVAT